MADHPWRACPRAQRHLSPRGGAPGVFADLESFVPPFDATAVSRSKPRRRRLGKTNCDELRWARQRKTCLWPDAQPLGDGPHSGRFERRIRRRGRAGMARSRSDPITAVRFASRPPLRHRRVKRPTVACRATDCSPSRLRLIRSAADAHGRRRSVALSVIAARSADARAVQDVPDYSASLRASAWAPHRRPSGCSTAASTKRFRALRTALDALVARGRRSRRRLPCRCGGPVLLVADGEASSNLARYEASVRLSRDGCPQDDLRTMYARTRSRGSARSQTSIMLGTTCSARLL